MYEKAGCRQRLLAVVSRTVCPYVRHRVCETVFMILSTQCGPCLFFMRLGAHDLITLSARRKEREEHELSVPK